MSDLEGEKEKENKFLPESVVPFPSLSLSHVSNLLLTSFKYNERTLQ